MKETNNAQIWIKRAESNLARAAVGKSDEKVLFEDLCFDCQQTVEKSLKALLVYNEQELIITHSIALLLTSIEENIKLIIPDFVYESVILTDYAVQMRYPGFYEPVTEEEFKTALQIATQVLNWVINEINNK
jgi:HEPN domain-containing protein